MKVLVGCAIGAFAATLVWLIAAVRREAPEAYYPPEGDDGIQPTDPATFIPWTPPPGLTPYVPPASPPSPNIDWPPNTTWPPQPVPFTWSDNT